jgi:hypothetical protein
VVFGGAVHDFIILTASVRRDGRSLAEIARQEINPFAGVTAMLAILFIVVIALAGLGLAVVNALEHSPWGMFTIAATIPLALFMGLYMYRLRAAPWSEFWVWSPRSSWAASFPARRSPPGSPSTAAPSSCSSPGTAWSPRSCRCGCSSVRAIICRRS